MRLGIGIYRLEQQDSVGSQLRCNPIDNVSLAVVWDGTVWDDLVRSMYMYVWCALL